MAQSVILKKRAKNNDLLQLAKIAHKFRGFAQPRNLSANYKRYLYDDRLKETIDILGDRGLVKAIQGGERDFKRGEYVTLEQLKKDLEIA